VTSIFRFEEQANFCLPPASTPVSCAVFSSSLKIEAIRSADTSVDFQRTTRRYIPEDGILLKLCLCFIPILHHPSRKLRLRTSRNLPRKSVYGIKREDNGNVNFISVVLRTRYLVKKCNQFLLSATLDSCHLK
jgi:hypothetical protein